MIDFEPVAKVPDVKDKEYEATFNVLMPSNVKTTTYKITVKAGDQVEAMARAIDAWKAGTEPTDVQIKELKSAVSTKNDSTKRMN